PAALGTRAQGQGRSDGTDRAAHAAGGAQGGRGRGEGALGQGTRHPRRGRPPGGGRVVRVAADTGAPVRVGARRGDGRRRPGPVAAGGGGRRERRRCRGGPAGSHGAAGGGRTEREGGCL